MRQDEEKSQKYIRSFIPLPKNLGLRISEEPTIEITTQVDYYSIYAHGQVSEYWLSLGWTTDY